MSSSDPKSKLDFLDSPAEVKKKIKDAFCEEGNIEENGVLSFFQAVVVPIAELRLRLGAKSLFVREGAPEGTVVSFERPEKFGGDLHFKTYEEIEKSFAEKDLHPGDLKKGMVSRFSFSHSSCSFLVASELIFSLPLPPSIYFHSYRSSTSTLSSLP